MHLFSERIAFLGFFLAHKFARCNRTCSLTQASHAHFYIILDPKAGAARSLNVFKQHLAF